MYKSRADAKCNFAVSTKLLTMENVQFKTNIKCGGCIEKVKPELDQAVGAGNWKVDITSPEKILTLSTNIEPTRVKAAVEKAGFTAEQV